MPLYYFILLVVFLFLLCYNVSLLKTYIKQLLFVYLSIKKFFNFFFYIIAEGFSMYHFLVFINFVFHLLCFLLAGQSFRYTHLGSAILWPGCSCAFFMCSRIRNKCDPRAVFIPNAGIPAGCAGISGLDYCGIFAIYAQYGGGRRGRVGSYCDYILYLV